MAKRKQINVKIREHFTFEDVTYHTSDEIFCYRYPDKQLSYGTINNIYPKSSIAPAFDFLCYMTGTFRTALFKDIIKSPTKKMMNKRDSAINSLHVQKGGHRRKR